VATDDTQKQKVRLNYIQYFVYFKETVLTFYIHYLTILTAGTP
jgi:hypothetical protein